MDATPEEHLRAAASWRRTGLVLGWGAVGCGGAAAVAWVVERPETGVATGGLLVLGLIGALLAPVFLRRAWSVPAVQGDPAAARARGWSDVAITAYCLSVVLGFVADDLLDLDGSWLVAVRFALATALVVAYAGMLVLATRWRPAPAGQL